MHEKTQAVSPIVTKSLASVHHMIISACLLATDPNLETLLEDDQYSDLIV